MTPATRRSSKAGLLLALLAWAAPATRLDAQPPMSPVFRIRLEEAGRTEGAAFTSVVETAYWPCAIWEGGANRDSPAALLARADGLLGLAPGTSMPFYAGLRSGTARGADGTTAAMLPAGDGVARTTVRDQNGTSVYDAAPASPPAHHADARFLRTAEGARLTFAQIYIPGGGAGDIGCVNLGAMDVDPTAVARFFAFEFTAKELRDWPKIRKVNTQTFRDDSGELVLKATLFVELEGPAEVDVVVEGYGGWIPAGNLEDESLPGNRVRVKAVVKAAGGQAAREARIVFELEDAGREPGVCCNWPVQAAAGRPDLRLPPADNPGLEPEAGDADNRKLSTRGYVREATLTVAAFDFAAWGVLKVTAFDREGKALRVTYHGERRAAVQLPQDEDRNRIADAWQEKKGVAGLPAAWDEAEVEGQETKGDGLALFQKYRGFVVATPAGRRHVRLEPREKAHFVIDPHAVFDPERWWRASGIRAYEVFGSWTKDRQVVLHRDYCPGPGKWAVRFVRDDTPVDESASEDSRATLRKQWAVSEGSGPAWVGTPRNVEVCTIHAGRILYTLRWLRAKMLRSLQNPENADDREEADWLLTLGLPREDLLARLERMTDADLRALLDPLVAWMAIHENAHACGVDGHLNAAGEEDAACPAPVFACPMQYLDWRGKRRLVLFGELGGQGPLCRAEPHCCWRRLRPRE